MGFSVGKVACALAIFAGGCAAEIVNPSFPATASQTHTLINRMQHDPKPLAHPLVIISGFADPNFAAPLLSIYFQTVTHDAKIIVVPVGYYMNVETCRRKVIEAVDKECPSSDPVWTTQVDVVGMSLGGLVGRYAAAPSRDPAHPRRLNIARLFTISSPHRGSTFANSLAGVTAFDRDMEDGSAFMQYVARFDSTARYQLFCYVHLHDDIVGDHNASPPGQNPYWLSDASTIAQHAAAMMDERIIADISLRLRNEPPLTRPPPIPLPD